GGHGRGRDLHDRYLLGHGDPSPLSSVLADPRPLPETAGPGEGSPPHFNRTRDNLLVALRLGEMVGFDAAARASLYHASLIVWARFVDATGTAPLKFVASHLAGRSFLARARMGVRFVAGGHRDVDSCDIVTRNEQINQPDPDETQPDL